MRKHIANLITGSRILGSILLLFFPVYSVEFYLLYIICGFSDMIDGTIARITNSTSQWGAKLDTVADLTFISVALIKLLPTIHLPQWLWIWGVAIAMIKIGNIIVEYASKKQFLSLHTTLNKITGLVLYLLPFTLSFIQLNYSSIPVCFLATCAAIQEGVCIATRRENR